MPPHKRLIILGCAVLTIFGLAESHHRSGLDAEVRPELQLIAEVRDKIHRYYVEPVDSLRILEGAVDGMAEALAQGEAGIQDSSALAEADSLLGNRPSLGNRAQLELLARTLDRLSLIRQVPYPADSLARAAVSGMLIALDPHSSYLDPQESEEMMERFQAHFEGIGIYFDIHQGKLVVISPIEGSPSYGRLRAGDHITAIDGASTEGITNDQVMQKLRGPRGTRVQVRVARPGVEGPLDITLTRTVSPSTACPTPSCWERGPAISASPALPSKPERNWARPSASSPGRAWNGWCWTCGATAGGSSPRPWRWPTTSSTGAS